MDENPIVQEEAIIPQDEPAIESQLEDTEDVQAIKDNAERMETFARQTLARAKKAEEDLRTLKKAQESKPATQAETLSQASVEETILLANGMSEELLGELKAVASVRKTSLIKAQADPLFVAAKEIFEKAKKQKEASLPASRGSGQTKVKKDTRSSGLTREEHKALAQAAMGNR